MPRRQTMGSTASRHRYQCSDLGRALSMASVYRSPVTSEAGRGMSARTDPTPSLAQFQKYVSEGRIHYYLGGGGGGFGAGGSTSSDASAIASWVSSHYTATTVDGVTVYDLTVPTT